MLGRFTGPGNRHRLVGAIRQQTIVQGDEKLAGELAEIAELFAVSAGQPLVIQNAVDDDLFLILVGTFAIVVKGREVARRGPGNHVGEMALIDVKAKRSASVTAIEDSVVARISEPSFTKVAADHPELWRMLARGLADRLRQRNELVRERNVEPHVFIGSTIESLELANQIQFGLKHAPFVVKVWTNHVFGASDFSLESLEDAIVEADFAILVCNPEDKVIVRNEEHSVPRDNVIFEIGLFMGALGRRRVFLVLPKGITTKLPTDLLGLTPITYTPGNPKDLASRLGPVCTEIRELITKKGPK